MSDREHRGRSAGAGRQLTGAACVLLLLGLWTWGRGVTDARQGIAAPTTGDIAAVGRPAEAGLPPAHRPATGALPLSVAIPAAGVRARVVARGLDGHGAVDPPPFDRAGTVGWYAAGVRPGAAGTALMVGHVDTESRPAVFYRLSTLRTGERIRVVRADRRVAEFTVDDVRVQSRRHFDAQQAYGARQSGRAELRLITCGGTFDRAAGSYTANVIVSAYLTDLTDPVSGAS